MMSDFLSIVEHFFFFLESELTHKQQWCNNALNVQYLKYCRKRCSGKLFCSALLLISLHLIMCKYLNQLITGISASYTCKTSSQLSKPGLWLCLHLQPNSSFYSIWTLDHKPCSNGFILNVKALPGCQDAGTHLYPHADSFCLSDLFKITTPRSSLKQKPWKFENVTSKRLRINIWIMCLRRQSVHKDVITK